MANNVIIPATGSGGSNNPSVETIDTTGSGGPQRQVFRQGRRLNPISTLTRPANTLTYSQGDLVASNISAGGIIVPSFLASMLNNMSGIIQRIRLSTNGYAMDGITLGVDLWTAAPTFNSGDNGTYGLSQQNTLSGLTWASTGGGSVTGTTTLAHGLVPGQSFILVGNTPSVFNGIWTAVSGTAGNQINFLLPGSNPGAVTTLGYQVTAGIASGSSSWLARVPSIVLSQFGDGAAGDGLPDATSGGLPVTEVWFLTGASTALLYWTLFTVTGFTPASSQTFTLTAEILQD